MNLSVFFLFPAKIAVGIRLGRGSDILNFLWPCGSLLRGIFMFLGKKMAVKFSSQCNIITELPNVIVGQIPRAIFQGGGLQNTTFFIMYQNVRLGL